MGRQHHGPTAHNSSIALLQERFRQLQRNKEMREGRELHRVLAEAENPAAGMTAASTATPREQQPRWFVHQDLVHPSRPLQGHFTLQSDPREGQRRDFQAYDNNTQLSIGLWPYRPKLHSYKNPTGTDVDTSLHL